MPVGQGHFQVNKISSEAHQSGCSLRDDHQSWVTVLSNIHFFSVHKVDYGIHKLISAAQRHLHKEGKREALLPLQIDSCKRQHINWTKPMLWYQKTTLRSASSGSTSDSS